MSAISGMRVGLALMGRVLAIAAAPALAAGPAVADEAQDVYAAGREAVFAERWTDVRRTFEEFSRRFPASSYADDAHYWLGMALYELGESERAYSVLKAMNANYPGSPWSDDGRALMIRCAEAVLKSADPGPRRASGRPAGSPLVEYESFIERSTTDSSSKVQLLAIDTMLITRPEKASELLPRLSDAKAPPDAAGMVLDRFFGTDRVKVTLEDPARGLTDENVAILVRDGDAVTHLTLSQALRVISPSSGPDARFDRRVVSEIRDRLLAAERQMVREGDPGSMEARAGREGEALSAIVKVVDGEVHYYRHESEVTRIVVLRRQAGFNDRNVKIFTETRAGIRELTLDEARRIPSAAAQLGLSEATVRYLKAALAIIEIDLSRAAGES